MHGFPRTDVGGVSVSRMVIGTNWFLGFSHCTPAKDAFLKVRFDSSKKVADILEVFFRAGVNAIIGSFERDYFAVPGKLSDAVRDAEDRTGVPGVIISTPSFTITPETPVRGFDMDEVRRLLDEETRIGTKIVMPHTCTTDAMVDRCTREVRQMAPVCREIRERGMVPGLSTHLPECVIYADESGLDVESYIVIYNAAGFLMPLEVDWTARIISEAKKPVLTIKPLAAGQLRPLQGLTFVWNTIRDRDMVSVGTLSPGEAEELIEISLRILGKSETIPKLQATRSKAAVLAASS